ncbi:protein kinase [Cystobacter ferrugineus]|uniref:protein kinase n=1 Tax=Cystobacter ferrugineus TaxID=83449 RepID=UPI000A89A6F5|nr:protein kinase [Cystobacter ferrugineus]
MSPLIPGDILGGTWRVVRPALSDEPGVECQVEPTQGGEAGRLTLWRTLRAPSRAELEHFTHVLREAQRTGHTAFAPVVDTGYDEAREGLWLVRPWWSGESLPSMLRGLHEIGVDLPDLRALARQLAGALTAARNAGLVHGRLRSSRVLVASGPAGARLSVLDMGLEHFRRTHAAGWLKPPEGGADYLAPEWKEEGPLPASTDVFAFGRILRDMLASRRDGAWKGRWESWAARATAPAPHERFGDATEALDALLPILNTLPTPVSPPPDNYQPEPPDPLVLPPR